MCLSLYNKVAVEITSFVYFGVQTYYTPKYLIRHYLSKSCKVV